ncbi:unnamed protein product [Prorocentrum cordatum]|uniref:Uncharacterized protein n=1 Tax=Prorocentrum cordatum TaxID=2364126 RepID=A0ABN9XD49_9DINO|nr:unnamed protein product [Polarella glacialis]
MDRKSPSADPALCEHLLYASSGARSSCRGGERHCDRGRAGRHGRVPVQRRHRLPRRRLQGAGEGPGRGSRGPPLGRAQHARGPGRGEGGRVRRPPEASPIHAGNDLVVATVHDFKTAVGEHAKGKLQESVSEVNSAAEGGGSSVGVKEIKHEEVVPSQKMTSEGVEEFAATQFGLQAITFKEGTGELSDESEARVLREFVEPLKAAKGKAGSGAQFLFCIFYSTTAGADNVKEGLMQQRGEGLEKIVTRHADEVLGSGSYKVGGKFEGYESDRLGAIVYKVTKGGQEAACSPQDAQIAESGKVG